MIDEQLKQLQEKMDKTLQTLGHELGSLRTGKASVAMLDSVRVDYYGSQMPIHQVATIGVPDPRSIVITPWEKQMLSVIEKAIQSANLGITPVADGHSIRLPIPALTEDRRKELTKVAKKFGEDNKVALRNIRRTILEETKALQKAGKITEDDLAKAEKKIQETTDKYISKIDEAVNHKEHEILQV